MFEGFSFSSASSRKRPSLQLNHSDDVMMPCDSNMVSPLSSRCPSPVPMSPSSTERPRFSSTCSSRSQSNYLRPAPTSIPRSYMDDRRRFSIGSLTHKLHTQSLENDVSYADRQSSRSRSSSKSDMQDVDMPLADTRTITTSHWDPLTPEDTDRDEGPSCARADIRNQRETLSILQSTTCNIGETVRLAVLLNDADRLRFDDRFVDESHHPSSIPPLRTQRRPPASRRPSTTAPTSATSSQTSRLGPNSRRCKIDKSHYSPPSSGVSGNTSLFSSQGQGLGLRRRSLVLAAVSAVLEAEQAANQRRPSTTSGGLLTPRSSPDAQPQPRRSSRSLQSRSQVTR